MGFTVPRSSPSRAVGSYPTVSPLPAARIITPAGGLFSVALSIGSPRLGVTQHFALWSSDFPHPKRDATTQPACKANQRINGTRYNYDSSSSKLVVVLGGWVGFVYSSIRLFVYSSIRLFVYSSIRLFVYSSIRLFVYSSIRLFVYSSIRLFVYSSIRLFVYSSIRDFFIFFAMP